jgi:hypothetical protein
MNKKQDIKTLVVGGVDFRVPKESVKTVPAKSM